MHALIFFFSLALVRVLVLVFFLVGPEVIHHLSAERPPAGGGAHFGHPRLSRIIRRPGARSPESSRRRSFVSDLPASRSHSLAVFQALHRRLNRPLFPGGT
ncbi:hypothetical protein PF011_g19793 [Phytophthora fragariae]|uniref:Uncharacterized protein n=1 Tax=Phytophthora fragariae TaxID=53985 RepID=A0A6A3IY16_9STRA|nr:hypothetical protein PF011_g19793 [Phytophthora fragariae]